MVHTRNSFNDPDAMSKILVEYVESGRSVVISDGFMDKVRGDFVGLGYSPIESVGVVGELSDCIQYLGDGNTLLYSGIGPRSGFCATVNNRDENLTITHDAVPDGSYSDGTPAAVYSPEFRVVYLNGAYCWGSAFPSVNCPGGDQPRRWANACLASRVQYDREENIPTRRPTRPMRQPAPSWYTPRPTSFRPTVMPSIPQIFGELYVEDEQEGGDSDFRSLQAVYSFIEVSFLVQFWGETPLDDAAYIYLMGSVTNHRIDFTRESFLVREDRARGDESSKTYETILHVGETIQVSNQRLSLYIPRWAIPAIADKLVYAYFPLSGDRIPNNLIGVEFSPFSEEESYYDINGGYEEGRSDSDCELDCFNGGYCVNDRMNTTSNGAPKESCYCLDGFTGPFCETDYEDCPNGLRCLNGGACAETPYSVGNYLCICNIHSRDDVLPFAGMMCEFQATSLCSTGPQFTSYCVNGGACIMLVSSGETHKGCKCSENYQGAYCQYENGSVVFPVGNMSNDKQESSWPNYVIVLILVFAAVVGLYVIGVIYALFCRNKIPEAPPSNPGHSAGAMHTRNELEQTSNTLDTNEDNKRSKKTVKFSHEHKISYDVEAVPTAPHQIKNKDTEEEKEEIQPLDEDVTYDPLAVAKEEKLEVKLNEVTFGGEDQDEGDTKPEQEISDEKAIEYDAEEIRPLDEEDTNAPVPLAEEGKVEDEVEVKLNEVTFGGEDQDEGDTKPEQEISDEKAIEYDAEEIRPLDEEDTNAPVPLAEEGKVEDELDKDSGLRKRDSNEEDMTFKQGMNEVKTIEDKEETVS